MKTIQLAADNPQQTPTDGVSDPDDLQSDVWFDTAAIEPEDLNEARYERRLAVTALQSTCTTVGDISLYRIPPARISGRSLLTATAALAEMGLELVAPGVDLDAVLVDSASDLPDTAAGFTDYEARIWLHRRLTNVGLRSTIVHECVHLSRGEVSPDPAHRASECAVEETASRLLIDTTDLIAADQLVRDGVPWAAVSERLGVDSPLLRTRLQTLTAREVFDLSLSGVGVDAMRTKADRLHAKRDWTSADGCYLARPGRTEQ